MADHNITIDIKANGADTTVKVLKEIRDDVNSLNKSDVTINFKVNTAGVTRAINSLKGDLMDIAGANAELQSAMGELISTGFQGILDKMDEINNKTVSPQVDSDGLEEAASRAERLAAGLDMAAGIASGLSSVFSGLGDFGGMFADSFEAMSSMFSFDALGTAKRYLTAMATRAITGQIGGTIQRYDIMNTFEDYMELAGVDSVTAQASLNAVDQSIRGIPIGLDEAAFRLRKYQMYLGDIDQATRFTIGIQKAITAGGASDQMKTTAYTQIDRLLATGKLGQSRQWLSLFNGLGVSLKFLREELALDPTADLKTVAADLASGAIPVEDFISAIERLSENEGLDRALEIYKGTIEAWKSNINNAIKRGGQNVMENVNDVMEETLGFGITGAMKMVRDGIDDISKDAGQYIQDNPEHVQTIGTAIGGLIERVMSLDGGRFVDNVVTNLGGIADVIGRIFDTLPDNFLEDFVSFATTWAGPLATAAKAAQSGLGVVLGVFERMQTLDPAELIEKIVGQIESMAEVVSGLLGIIPDGLLGDLMAFGLVWGKPLASVLGAVSGALKDISGVIAAKGAFSAANGIFGQLTSLAMMHPVLMGVAAAIGAIALGIKQVYDAEDARQKAGREMFGLDDIESTIEGYRTLGETIKNENAIHQANLEAIDEENQSMVEGIDTVFELYERYQATMAGTRGRAGTGPFDALKESIEDLATINEGLDLSALLTGDLSAEQVANIRQLADTYAEMTTAEARVEELEAAQQSARQLKATANIQKTALEETRTRLQNDLTQAQKTYSEFLEQAKARGTPFTNDWGEEDVRLTKEDDTYLRQLDAGMSNLRSEITSLDTEIAYQGSLYDQASLALDGYNDSLTIARRTLKQYADTDFSGMYQQVDQLDESLQKLVDTYTELKLSAAEALDKSISGFEKMDLPTAASIVEMTGGITSQNDALTAYGDALATIRNGLVGLSDEEIEQLGPAIAKVLEGGFENAEYAMGLAEAMKGSKEDLEAYVEATNQLIENKDVVASTIADLQTILAGGSEAETASRENTELFPGLQEALDGFHGLEEVDLSEFLTNVQSTSEDASAAFEDIEGAAQSAATQIDAVKTSMEQAASTSSGKSGEMASFSGSLDTVAGSATHAFTQVSALAGAIARLQDKTITIRVNFGVGFGGFANGGLAGYFASGGNASAGFPGMATGTDIIPAWLTPGEFVMRRSAVGLFGSRFMDRVNRMDIGGAFDALMQRVANPMNRAYGNTYNRDNHATVNNYFMGDNGQSYSQRKAYRFAGSL